MHAIPYLSEVQVIARLTAKAHHSDRQPMRRKSDEMERDQRIRDHESEIKRMHLGFLVIGNGVEI